MIQLNCADPECSIKYFSSSPLDLSPLKQQQCEQEVFHVFLSYCLFHLRLYPPFLRLQHLNQTLTMFDLSALRPYFEEGNMTTTSTTPNIEWFPTFPPPPPNRNVTDRNQVDDDLYTAWILEEEPGRNDTFVGEPGGSFVPVWVMVLPPLIFIALIAVVW